MRVLRPLLPLLLALSTTASFAGTLSSGAPFPLTNTRYGVNSGSAPTLVSNGRDAFLFWRTSTHFHYKRSDWDDSAPSHAVMEALPNDTYSVVWTGSYFLFIAGQGGGSLEIGDDLILGQLIDANGEMFGGPFVIARDGKDPHAAFDGERALLFWSHTLPPYGTRDEILMVPLRADGRPAAAAPTPTGIKGVVQALAANKTSLAAVVSTAALVEVTRKLVMFDRVGNVTASSSLGEDRYAVSLAANGERYLLVEGLPTLRSRLVESDGSTGAAFDLDGTALNVASVAWTGSKWAIAYNGPNQQSFSVVQLDALNKQTTARELHAGDWPSVATAGEHLVVAWRNRSSEIAIAETPLNETDGRRASFTATKQEVVATASAAYGTLILWWENGALHGGVRMNDGRWREQTLWPDRSPVAAATDGATFTIVISEKNNDGYYSPSVLRLDAEGRPLGDVQRSPEKAPTPFGAFWTGRDVAVVSPTSIVQAAIPWTSGLAPSQVYLGTEVCALAAGGDGGFYAIWLIGGSIGSPSWPPTGVAGIRLGPDFKPLDATPTILAGSKGGGSPPVFGGCDVAWDGQQYVVTWSGSEFSAAQIPAGGGLPVVRFVERVSSDDYVSRPKLTRAADGVALQWYQTRRFPTPDLLGLAILSADGTVTPKKTFDPPDRDAIRDSPLMAVASLPAGDVAIVRTTRQSDVPAEGSIRLAMSILSAAPLPERPRAPRLTAVRNGTVVNLRWDAPPTRVNGYRVESRVESQPWIEVEGVFPPDQQSALIPEVVAGRTTLFRVRAWNEAGPGEYSAAVVPVTVPRRRAAR
jgi:hypothetical protein